MRRGVKPLLLPAAAIAAALLIVLVIRFHQTGYVTREPAARNAEILTQTSPWLSDAMHRVETRAKQSGRIAGSNDEAWLEAPAYYAYSEMESLTVHPGGVIEARYRVLLGVEGGTVQWVPVLSANNPPLVLGWKCFSPNVWRISRYIPDCEWGDGAEHLHGRVNDE